MQNSYDWDERLDFDKVELDLANMNFKGKISVVLRVCFANIDFKSLPLWLLEQYDISILNNTDHEPSDDIFERWISKSEVRFCYYGREKVAAWRVKFYDGIHTQKDFYLVGCQISEKALFPNCRRMRWVCSDSLNFALIANTVEVLTCCDNFEHPILFPRLRKFTCRSFRNWEFLIAPHLNEISFEGHIIPPCRPWLFYPRTKKFYDADPLWLFETQKEFMWLLTANARRLIFMCLRRWGFPKDLCRVIARMIQPWDVIISNQKEKLKQFRNAVALKDPNGVSEDHYLSFFEKSCNYFETLREHSKVVQEVAASRKRDRDDKLEELENLISQKRAKLREHESFARPSAEEWQKLYDLCLSSLLE